MKDILKIVKERLDLRDFMKMNRLRDELASIIKMTNKNIKKEAYLKKEQRGQ